MKKILLILFAFLFIATLSYECYAASRGGSFSSSRSSSGFKSSKSSSSSKSSFSGSKGGSFSSSSKSGLSSSSPTVKSSSSSKSPSFSSQSITKSGSFGFSAKNESNKSSYNKSVNTKSTPVEKYRNSTTYKSNTPPPTTVQNYYSSQPSFGMWDTLFLYTLMSNTGNNMNNSQWFYHHQNDEDVKKFKEEMKKMSENDVEMKIKYEALEKELSELKEKDIPIDPTYKSDIEKSVDEEVLVQEIKEKEKNNNFVLWLLLGSGCLIGLGITIYIYRK